MAGGSRHGLDRLGQAGRGKAGVSGIGMSRIGGSRHGRHGFIFTFGESNEDRID
jgi:hypothetical protein